MFEYSIQGEAIEVVGALGFDSDVEGWVTPRRLPDWTRDQFADPGMERYVKFPSGVRLRFSTKSDSISLEVRVSKLVITGISEDKRPAAFDLLVNGVETKTLIAENGNTLRLTATAPAVFSETLEIGEIDILSFNDLGNDKKQIEIWFPTTAIVEVRKISTNQEISRSEKEIRKTWLHYGSSISQCSEAVRPMDAWPIRASQLLNLDIRNFGLAGECQLDGFVARTMAGLPADFISLKLGINVINADSMRERAFIPAVHNFLDILRERHTATPILVISSIVCPFHEDCPGPTMIDGNRLFAKERAPELAAGALTLKRSRVLLQEIVKKRNDKDLHFMDGLELFNIADRNHLPDGLHPDSAGYRIMGQRFALSQSRLFS
ncbi:MAG: lipase [Streptomycetaceae bacterium]|nr:MAG: lipase [Streptomycetaceae bacterium]